MRDLFRGSLGALEKPAAYRILGDPFRVGNKR